MWGNFDVIAEKIVWCLGMFLLWSGFVTVFLSIIGIHLKAKDLESKR